MSGQQDPKDKRRQEPCKLRPIARPIPLQEGEDFSDLNELLGRLRKPMLPAGGGKGGTGKGQK